MTPTCFRHVINYAFSAASGRDYDTIGKVANVHQPQPVIERKRCTHLRRERAHLYTRDLPRVPGRRRQGRARRGAGTCGRRRELERA